MEEELDAVAKRFKINKLQTLRKCAVKLRKQENLATDFFDYAPQSINKTLEKWMKGSILPFPKKGDLGITKNYRVIYLKTRAAKVHYVVLVNHIQPEIEKILRKNQNGFRRNFTDSDYQSNHQRNTGKESRSNITIRRFDSIHIVKMEQKLLAYGLPKETATDIMILYKKTKARLRFSDGDTNFFLYCYKESCKKIR